MSMSKSLLLGFMWDREQRLRICFGEAGVVDLARRQKKNRVTLRKTGAAATAARRAKTTTEKSEEATSDRIPGIFAASTGMSGARTNWGRRLMDHEWPGWNWLDASKGGPACLWLKRKKMPR